ncbi:uncharacterized protein LOC133516466 [Cydia pomonella]|uniref:uncharacterized protein LOC133516466 n=1 Tax=Cydia pomonella TaxID=82600 RepID=UPI002ADDA812|nr:uncharacterized protein LOC133516466 [Cydia pomonella]
MGPKKNEPVREDSWRAYIEDTPLNDDSWSVQVVMMEVAGSDQDRIYLNKFEVFAAEEKRFVIKNICKSETMFMINQLGGEKKVKDESLRVFEVGQAYLKEKKDIPPDIQALVVKHLILKMKEEYLFIQKQQLHVRDGMRRESATMIDRVEVRGTVCVPPSEPASPPPQPQGKGKKGEAVPVVVDEPEEGKKYNTLLRVRGEEWRDKVYVDDYPIDGPNLYVAVSGFLEPELAGCLIKIGVPLTAIFQIRIDLTSQPVPSSLTRPTKRGQSQTDVLIEQSLRFWQDLQQLRIDKATADDYKNTAFVIFSPPYWSADDLSGEVDKIYDELCFLMYDIQDLTRQRSHYLTNMDIINIPVEPKDVVYENYYQKLIDGLPLECCSIYSVLDSILETVCIKQQLSKDTSTTSLSDCLTLNQQPITSEEIKLKKAETLINDVFSALNATDSNKKAYRLTYGEESENRKDPIVINFGDFAKCQTFHLGNIHLDSIIFSMLFGMPINRLWYGQERPQDELEAKLNFHVNVLLSCFDRSDVETTELNRLLHILACRKLYDNRSSLKKDHLASITISEFKKLYLRRSVLAEPLPKISPLLVSSSTTRHSFPSITKIENSSFVPSTIDSEEQKIEFLFECPDISELVSASEIANNAPNDHIIDDFEVFEDFSETRAFQVLREAFTNFNCLDYKYCEVTDTFNLMFFNSHDHDGIAREEWRSHLPTPVCLQDFFDFVLEERYDWIQNEENLYEQKLTHDSQSQCAAVDTLALQSCVENQDVDMEMLIEGSLKFKEILENEVAEEQTTISSSTREKNWDGASTIPTSRIGDSKSSKKSKTAAVSSPTMSLDDSNTDILIPTKPFHGYDLSERRVEVFGKDGTFYSKDGTRVSSRYSFIIPMNLEYIILSVVPGNGFNEFWVHRSLGESVSPEATNACESFRISSKDQVALNFKKELYHHPIPIPSGSSTHDNVQLKTKEPVPKIPSETEMAASFELKTFHSLCVTWPNGLITESVHEHNSSTLSHIKQHYLVPGPLLDEEMRCISLKGEVIIFKISGIIEVFRPDGTYVKITKYGKRLPNDLPPPPPVPTKAQQVEKPPKTAKNVKLEPDTVTTSTVPVQELELFIDEFEIIETTGLRQLWVEDRSYDIEKLLIRTATDYCLGEVYSRRMDGTQILLNKDGVQIVTFPNRTRIITKLIVEEQEIYPEWTEDEAYYFDTMESGNLSVKSKCSVSPKSSSSHISRLSRLQSYQSSMSERKQAKRTDGYISVRSCYTIEHEKYTSITVNTANGNVTVNSPNNTSVTLNTDNQYEINLDPVTVATFNGQDLIIDYSGCTECNSKTTCRINICQGEMSSLRKIPESWLQMEDSFCKSIVVNEEGAILLDERNTQLNTSLDTQALTPASGVHVEETELKLDDRVPSNTSTVVHGKCRKMFSAKEMRFFILRRDLTCSELVNRIQLEEDMKVCRFQPWCSINEYDTFGDRRSLLAMLTPVALTETEKWVMNSQLSSKASSLRYKDLKKDCGKGFYHWMRPYERFEPKPQSFEGHTPRLPRAFILRILEKQWKGRDREQFKGARELLRAVLKYRRVMESDCENILRVPVIDSRSENERHVHDLVQALGHRVYAELKARLDAAVANNAKPDITTRPVPQKDFFEETEQEEDVADSVKKFEAERESLVQEALVAEMSPNLKRYWRRREEEYKEEQFYLHLLREGSVPPYFRNVLGGAIWWEMNNTAGAAVDRAERRKMKCVCDEAGSKEDVLPFM